MTLKEAAQTQPNLNGALGGSRTSALRRTKENDNVVFAKVLTSIISFVFFVAVALRLCVL